MENPSKYTRGSFEFNFCFIIAEKTFKDPHYKDIVTMILKKISSILTQMELETDFLSCTLAGSKPKSDVKDPAKISAKRRLQYLI